MFVFFSLYLASSSGGEARSGEGETNKIAKDN